MSEQAKANAWTTGVTAIEPNRVAVRGYPIAELMGRVSFGAAVYLILRGELPSEPVGRLMDAILVSSIDHGATPPSCLAARTVASTGASLSASVAAGVMSINEHHGGAIEGCALALGEVIEMAGGRGGGENVSKPSSSAAHIEQAGKEFVAQCVKSQRRVSGFGHRIHTADPRTGRLFELAKEASVSGGYIDAARAVEKAFSAAGKALPINVDGAIAACLAQLGFDPGAMNGIFMIARVPGLVAHVVEEKSRCKPMRKIDPVAHRYDGPAERAVPR